MSDKPTTDRITEYQQRLDAMNKQIAITSEELQACPERWTLKYVLENHQNHKEAIEDVLELLRKQPTDETQVEQEVRLLLEDRNKIGRETYGKGLDHSDLKWNWNDMALEEIMDFIKYFMAQKLRAQHGIELTDENIEYVAGKIYYDRTGHALNKEVEFIKQDWYNEAKNQIENYNYLTQLLWGADTQK